jgi:hypothetical protein
MRHIQPWGCFRSAAKCQLRQQCGQLGPVWLDHNGESFRRAASEAGPQQVEQRSVGSGLILGEAVALEHFEAPSSGERSCLGNETRFTDACLTSDKYDPADPAMHLVDKAYKRLDHVGTTNQHRAGDGSIERPGVDVGHAWAPELQRNTCRFTVQDC